METSPPQVILLNGTGSSGKTSIAIRLQELLPEQYLNFSIDSVLYALPPTDLKKMMVGERIDRAGYEYPRLVDGYHACLPALLSTGLKLIVDNAWTDAAEKRAMLTAISGFSSVLIGVRCDLEVAKAREALRGDRAIGLAAREFPLVHQHMQYDIEIDTSMRTPEACADELLARLSTVKLWTGATSTLQELDKGLNA